MEHLRKYIYTTAGRLNRLRYLKYSFAFCLAVGFLGAALEVFVGFVTGDPQGFLATLVSVAVNLVIFTGCVALMVRRLHDLDRPEWWAVGVLIPLVNFALSLYLLLAPGTHGHNRYGEDPLRY